MLQFFMGRIYEIVCIILFEFFFYFHFLRAFSARGFCLLHFGVSFVHCSTLNMDVRGATLSAVTAATAVSVAVALAVAVR